MKLYLALSMAVSLVMTATASPVDNIIYQRAFQNSEIGKQQYLYNAYEEFVPQNDEIPNDISTNDAVFMRGKAYVHVLLIINT